MGACCKGAFDGRHDDTCAVGRAASEAAPESYSPPPARPQLTDEQKAKHAALLDAIIADVARFKEPRND
jgi:hypothetical protein